MILTGLENSFLNAALFFWIVYLFITLFRDRVRELLNIDKLRFLLNRTSMTELDKSYLHLSRKLSNSSNMMHSLKSLVCCIRGLLHSFYTFPDSRPVGASDQEGGRKMCRWQGNVFFFSAAWPCRLTCGTSNFLLAHFQCELGTGQFVSVLYLSVLGLRIDFFNSGHVCPQILEMIKFALEKSTETGDTDWLLSHRQQHEKHNINVAPGSLFHASRAQHRITPINCCH